MFLQSLLRWFQKRRASSWNQLYAEAPVTKNDASACYYSVEREKDWGFLVSPHCIFFAS